MPGFGAVRRLESFEISPRLQFRCGFGRRVIHGARTRAARVTDLSIKRKRAVVAGTEETLSLGVKVHKAAGVRANHVEGFDGLSRAAQIDSANGRRGEFVPGISVACDHGKFPRQSILRKGCQGGDEHEFAGFGLLAEWIKEHHQAAHQWDQCREGANEDGGRFFKETAPIWLHWRRL